MTIQPGDACPLGVISRTECDLLIVGAGPVGLYAAYYAGFRGLRTAVLDSLPEVGGQITAMYPEKPIYDIAGFPSSRGRDLVGRPGRAGGPLPSDLPAGGSRAALADPQLGRPNRVVGTAAGTVVDCGAVLICGGIGSFSPRPLTAGSHGSGAGSRSSFPR